MLHLIALNYILRESRNSQFDLYPQKNNIIVDEDVNTDVVFEKPSIIVWRRI